MPKYFLHNIGKLKKLEKHQTKHWHPLTIERDKTKLNAVRGTARAIQKHTDDLAMYIWILQQKHKQYTRRCAGCVNVGLKLEDSLGLATLTDELRGDRGQETGDRGQGENTITNKHYNFRLSRARLDSPLYEISLVYKLLTYVVLNMV